MDLPSATPAAPANAAVTVVPTDANAPAARTCLNCGTPLTDRHCAACGQKDHAGHNRSVRAYLGEFLHALTHLDGRVWQTLRLLVTRPGELSRVFIGGARMRYVSPLHLFLFANIVYFFLTPLTDFDPKLSDHTLQPYAPVARSLIAAKLEQRGTTRAAYEPAFNAKSSAYAKSLVVVCIPLFAALLHLMHRRRPGALFYDDLVFSTHFFVFLLLVAFTLAPLLAKLTLLPLAGLFDAESAMQRHFIRGLLVWIAVYGALALRRVFPGPWLSVLARTLGVLVAIFVAGTAFKFLLLVLTLAST